MRKEKITKLEELMMDYDEILERIDYAFKESNEDLAIDGQRRNY